MIALIAFAFFFADERAADAHVHVQRLFADFEDALLERLAQRLGEMTHILVRSSGENHAERVFAEAARDVGFLDVPAHEIGHVTQQQVGVA